MVRVFSQTINCESILQQTICPRIHQQAVYGLRHLGEVRIINLQ